MKKKACVYCRVSTEHLEQDSSLKNQVNFFNEHYSNEYDILKVYAEKESGVSIGSRDAFKQMLMDCGLDIEEKRGNINIYTTNKEPMYNYILTKSISRFSRNTEIITIIRKLKEQGVFIIFHDVNVTTEKETDNLLLGIMQNIAEEESRNRSRIIKFGKKRSAEANIIPMHVAPYGYVNITQENRLKAIPHEAEIIRMVFDMYVDGHGVRKIKQILTDKGIYNRKGKPFTEAMLLYIVQNPKYCGVNVRNRFNNNDLFSETQKQIQLPEEEWIAMKNERIDTIIDDETFQNAQEVINTRRKNGKGYRGFSKSKYANKLVCACGGNYIHDVKRDGSGFYICNKRKKIGKIKCGCNSRNITEVEIDQAIKDHVESKYFKLLNDKIDKANKNLLVKIKEVKATNFDNVTSKIEELNNKINANKNKLDKLIDMLIESSDAKEEVINNKISKIEEENKDFEKQKADYDAIISDRNKVLENLNDGIEKLKIMKGKTKEPLTEEKFINEIIQITINENDELEIDTMTTVLIDATLLATMRYDTKGSFMDNFGSITKSISDKISNK